MGAEDASVDGVIVPLPRDGVDEEERVREERFSSFLVERAGAVRGMPPATRGTEGEC